MVHTRLVSRLHCEIILRLDCASGAAVTTIARPYLEVGGSLPSLESGLTFGEHRGAHRGRSIERSVVLDDAPIGGVGFDQLTDSCGVRRGCSPSAGIVTIMAARQRVGRGVDDGALNLAGIACSQLKPPLTILLPAIAGRTCGSRTPHRICCITIAPSRSR